MLIITSAVIILLSLGYAAAGPSLFPFRPDPTDTIGHILQSDEKNAGPKTKHLFSDWNIVARIDVWNHDDAHLNLPEKVPYKLLTVDAGAATLLIGDPGKENWGDALFKKSLYGAVYWTKPNPQDVLIIGAGGGTDIQTALNNGAQDVTAVEINTTTIGAVTGQFADFLAWPKSNKVNLVHEDGRSYVKSPKKKFDLIQMSGVDTVTVYATGAFNMVEENLYTVEAFQDYLSALKPDGVLGVLRFGSEHLRLAAIASEALMREGITSPEKHIVALRQSRLAGIIVSKKPFDEAMLDQIAAYTSRKKPTKLRMPPFEQYNLKIQSPVKEIYVPGRIISKKFAHYFKKLKSGKAAQKKLFTRLALPTDDTPFFLFTNLLTAPKGNLLAPVENAISLLKRFWVTIIVLAFILILCPVFVLRRKMDSYGPLIWLIPYFFAIGTSFMLIEIGTISAFSIFVGSPGASTAVVLTSILLSSGIGSYLSEFSKREPHIKIVLATIFLVCAALFAKFISPIIFDACWKAGLGQVTRGIVAGLCIAPLGFAMGWFFPSGLKAIARYLGDTRLIPWAFSINGFASVLGSIVALPLSIFYGFTTLFAIGLAGYIATALLTFGFFLKKSPIKV